MGSHSSDRKMEVLAAKIIVYAEGEDEYFSFIFKETYLALKEWMNYRELSGELIDENSWIMRDLWDTGIYKEKNL